MSDAPELIRKRGARWSQGLALRRNAIAPDRPLIAEGRLRRVVGLTLEAVGCEAPLGGRCLVTGSDGTQLETEVVGFAGDRLYLMPAGEMHGLPPNARVRPLDTVSDVPVGEALLGRWPKVTPDGDSRRLPSSPK